MPALLVLLSLVPALAGGVRLAQLVGGAEVTLENARFFAAPTPVLLHIPASIVYSLLGAFQFAPGFRRRRRGWHRAAGTILIPCALVVALSGLWMTLVYPWPAGDGVVLYAQRLVFGTAMLLSVILGAKAIRRRNFVSHGEWMIRAYAIGLGAGTQVLTHLPWFVVMNRNPGEVPRALMMGAGWLINIVVAEWIIRKGRARRQAAGKPKPRPQGCTPGDRPCGCPVADDQPSWGFASLLHHRSAPPAAPFGQWNVARASATLRGVNDAGHLHRPLGAHGTAFQSVCRDERHILRH